MSAFFLLMYLKLSCIVHKFDINHYYFYKNVGKLGEPLLQAGFNTILMIQTVLNIV